MAADCPCAHSASTIVRTLVNYIQLYVKSLHSHTLFSADCSNSYHGVGFIVAYDVDCKFKSISNRLALLTVYRKYTNKVHPLYIISAYAPTSQITKENPIQTDIFYQDLEDLINSVNKKELIICGDFNAKTGSANSYLPKHVGKYNSANYTNTNGEFLVDLIVRNNLYLCNTFFKHKLEHVNTWTSNFTPAHKRNPTRTQIDYIIAPLNFKSINTNARAYNGIQTNSDHKLLIGIFELNNCTRRKIYPKPKNVVNSSTHHLKSNKTAYDTNVNDALNKTTFSTSPDTYWKELSTIYLDTAKDLNPNPTNKVRFINPDIAKLSKVQKDIRLQIDYCKNVDEKNKLKTKRNKIIKQQHFLVKSAQEQKLSDEIAEIENCKDDSHRFFKAIKIVQHKTKKDPIRIKVDDIHLGSIEAKIKEISKHFESVFNCPNPTPDPDVFPEKLINPFSEGEIRDAISSLKNNKSPGCDKITAEHIKYAPCTHKHIAAILNNIAETGKFPSELKQGILTPIQKPGKPKGPPENLRPIILLSIIRKVFAVCVTRRIRDKVDKHILPVTQTAYTAGRSTAELVFSFKILAEKAITSNEYKINLLLLDMSKAFDTLQRGTLLSDLQPILNNDELHLISLLLHNVSYTVKLDGQLGQPFTTNIGSPQGDSASALFFIAYLANSLKSLSEDITNQPSHLPDHDHNIPGTKDLFTLDQQYADDIGWASTDNNVLQEIEHKATERLAERNLKINNTKTEKYSISRNGDPSWSKCKYVGSLLGTNDDINRRIGMTNYAFNNLSNIFKNKNLSKGIKLRIFNALIKSIFLYNCELWGTTKALDHKIDAFQRRLLRNVLKIRWTNNNWISNEELYCQTNQTEWSSIVAHRRLRFFGHVSRLHDDAPAKLALREALKYTKKPRGRPVTTLLGTLKSQLKGRNINNFDDAMNLAQDRFKWRRIITEHVE